MYRWWRALAVVPAAAMLMLPASPVWAQEGTPDTGEADSPRLVAPVECDVAPRAFEEVAAMLALEGEGVPEPEMTQPQAPLGEIVDPETAIAIEEASRELIACFNAGDFLRAAGVMTENGVRRAFWGFTINEEIRQQTLEFLPATPEARSEEFWIRLLTVTDVSMLPDGRVAAFIVLNEPIQPPGGPETLLFIFANENGQWLFDDRVDFSIVPANFGAEATPPA
jgi:hypothetical protein